MKTMIEHIKDAARELVWACGVLLAMIIFKKFEDWTGYYDRDGLIR